MMKPPDQPEEVEEATVAGPVRRAGAGTGTADAAGRHDRSAATAAPEPTRVRAARMIRLTRHGTAPVAAGGMRRRGPVPICSTDQQPPARTNCRPQRSSGQPETDGRSGGQHWPHVCAPCRVAAWPNGKQALRDIAARIAALRDRLAGHRPGA